MMKLNFVLFASFLFVATLTLAQKQEIIFDVIYKDEKVGALHAQETKVGSKSIKVLTIETNSTFFFIPIYMESEVTAIQQDGVLIEGTAYRDASRKSSDVIATVTKIGFQLYQRERNGVNDQIKNKNLTFCVVDLYFKEPVGVTQVFSNMYSHMLQLKRIDTGKYKLITPNNNNSIYTYVDGKLVSIEANTFVGKIFSVRI
ncbi:MAG: hypothetical protein JJE09_11345 [Bacteroidia bacterium]|nr:hypothetical protein [Bacteroidia bacterium]